jgi:hypothetical protein
MKRIAFLLCLSGVVLSAQSADLKKKAEAALRALYGDPGMIIVFEAPALPGGPPSPRVQAAPGQIAEGVVLTAAEDQLSLNWNPCGSKTMIFTKPYTRKTVGKKECKGTLLTIEEVRQGQ